MLKVEKKGKSPLVVQIRYKCYFHFRNFLCTPHGVMIKKPSTAKLYIFGKMYWYCLVNVRFYQIPMMRGKPKFWGKNFIPTRAFWKREQCFKEFSVREFLDMNKRSQTILWLTTNSKQRSFDIRAALTSRDWFVTIIGFHSTEDLVYINHFENSNRLASLSTQDINVTSSCITKYMFAV